MKKLYIFLILTISLHLTTINNSFGQWQQTNGPTGETINCLSISRSNMYAGTNEGVFLSTDEGANWEIVNNGLTDTTIVYSFAISGTNIFAGTTVGVFISADSGGVWSPVNNGLADKAIVTSLVVSDTNIFAGTFGGGVFLTTANDLNWEPKNNGIKDTNIISLAIKGKNIFAGTYDGGVFLSTDNGSSWGAVNNGLPSNTQILSLTINDTNVFAGTNFNGLFMSTDNGKSWNQIMDIPQNISILSLAVSGKIIFAGAHIDNGNGGIFISTDNGSVWKAENDGFQPNTNVKSLALTATDVYAGLESNGVWKQSLSKIVKTNEVTEKLNKNGIMIYPNPVIKSAGINYEIANNSNVQIKIYDLAGKEVETLLNENKDKGIYTLIFDSNNLKNGIYFVKFQTNQSTITTKLIKNNF